MSVIGPRPGLWNQDILTAERDKYNANDAVTDNYILEGERKLLYEMFRRIENKD